LISSGFCWNRTWGAWFSKSCFFFFPLADTTKLGCVDSWNFWRFFSGCS
jgi:hypothetical protein